MIFDLRSFDVQIRCSVFQLSVPFGLRSFGLRSFGVGSLFGFGSNSTFCLSTFCHSTFCLWPLVIRPFVIRPFVFQHYVGESVICLSSSFMSTFSKIHELLAFQFLAITISIKVSFKGRLHMIWGKSHNILKNYRNQYAYYITDLNGEYS